MSQTKEILDWLNSGRPLTAMEALDNFNCFRLAARIADIRATGVEVTTKTIIVGRKKKKVAQYSLPQCDLFKGGNQ